MSKIVPVLLCGGSGTRLWPRSRAEKPKPFLPLIGQKTLFEATLERFALQEIFKAPVIVVGEHHLAHARHQAKGITAAARFVVEPVGRNTAPAIALAALMLDPDDILLVCPSDHHITDVAAFHAAVQEATMLAQEGWLVSFGIEATAPETGYGYLRRGSPLKKGYRIERFIEKPDLARALTFLADGRYAWNGGIFCFKASAFVDALHRHRPEMAEQARRAITDGRIEGDLIFPEATAFASIAGESIDYAVMENTDRAAMVDVAMGWSDIGNWSAIHALRDTDEHDNIIRGPGEILGASGSMIDSDGPHVTIIGASNIVVVVDGDDIVVSAREAAQDVGKAARCRP